MRKTIWLLAFLIFLSNPIWAQESQPLPRKLPTVIVKGEDKSYLEIIRTKGPAQMSYRGEKEIIQPSPEAYLGEKPGYYPPFHPILKKAPLVKFIPQERKEISPLPFSHPSFSTSPGGYEELISSLKYSFAAETAQMSYRGEKEIIQPSPEAYLGEKPGYYPPFHPI
ncbi:MAG: hypothetical protein U9R03_02225, partial [Candidatus Aerophobetes bacterium]|nr:hypothetical protein [Candidatus Aerophobetes bacterium]